MNIPYNSPIRFDEWEKRIKEDWNRLRDEFSLYPTALVLNPQTMHEIIQHMIKNSPIIVNIHLTMAEYFAGLKMRGNSDLERYEFRYEISHVSRSNK